MSEKLRESLSAVMDGEADTFEVRRVLDECAKDSELASIWGHYHLIGAVLSGAGEIKRTPMADTIWSAIDAEPVADSGGVQPLRRWARPLIGLGVAAAMAMAVIAAFDPADAPGPPVDLVVAEPGASGPVEVSQRDLERANAYFISHVQQTALNNRAGMMPFTKLVTYDQK